MKSLTCDTFNKNCCTPEKGMCFKDQRGLDEKSWMAAAEKLSYLAYEDQCSPANPRIPMVKDMQEILEKSWTGEVISYKGR